jgi:hypothetical protein
MAAQNQQFAIQKFTNNTTFSASYTLSGGIGFQSGRFGCFQINDNGTNRLYNFSFDGINYATVLTTTSSDFITPNQIGFAADPFSSVAPTNTLMILGYQ